LIEDAYRLGEKLGLAVWCEDEAGPYQTKPYQGSSWQPAGHPRHHPHEYQRNGTAKMLTLFHPISGTLRVKGVKSCTNVVLHAWLKKELVDILGDLPEEQPVISSAENRTIWERWREGLTVKATLSADLPPLRMLLVMDNLKGHHTPDFLCWLFSQGILPLYTPLGGSWLNMAESIQRIIKRKALEGHYPISTDQIIAWLEAAAKGWNADPAPFEWGGKRKARRQRSRAKRYQLGGSGACTRRPIRHRKSAYQQWRCSCQLTHSVSGSRTISTLKEIWSLYRAKPQRSSPSVVIRRVISSSSDTIYQLISVTRSMY
jgi:hypothetical protein